jgi:hypothetical protein
MANLLLEDSDEAKAVRRSRRRAENFSRSARCHGHSRGHRSPGRPLARRVAGKNSQVNPTYGEGYALVGIIWS